MSNNNLAIITPTRGRPERFADLVEAIARTVAGPVDVWVGLDDDDPARYMSGLSGRPDVKVHVVTGPRQSLSAWTNELAGMAFEDPEPPRYLASLGDDHRPRTPGWDRLLIEAIELGGGSGFAYGDDLFQGRNVPTAWVVSADIVRALGWMMLPACAHMYVDNVTLQLGTEVDGITYMPGVVVEHLHPAAGKAVWDDSYRESNTVERYDADRAAFEAWRDGGGLARDVETILALQTVGQTINQGS